jgi:hypothetical protein
MDDLEVQDLLEVGFEEGTEMRYTNNILVDNYTVKTGDYVLPAWDPEPRVTFNTARRSIGWIGSLHTRIETKADLDKFLTKNVPTFCELK